MLLPTRLPDLPPIIKGKDEVPAQGSVPACAVVVTEAASEQSPAAADAADPQWEPLHPMHRHLHDRLQPPAQNVARPAPEPSIKPLPGGVRVAILIGAAAGSWVLVVALTKRLLALF
ncbi:MAG: hypothetical protein ABJA20_02650 [Novosphingobium sp.]